MLTAAVALLSLAVVLGATLAVLYLRRGNGTPSPWRLAAVHGLLGVGGFCCLVLAARGPPRGVEQGVGSFGAISATLFGLAAVAGGIILVKHLAKRRAGTLIGLHATLAIAGFVILAAYLFA